MMTATRSLALALAVLPVALVAAGGAPGEESTSMPVRFMTLDPGHFHASLVQKEMYPGVVSPRVDVYAPVGTDLVEHLGRITAFNTRTDSPTSWQLEIHAGPDFFERMLKEHPGNVVVLSGRNQGKIDRIAASVHAGLNVLADKPWILKSQDLPALEKALAEADAKGVVAYDIMTERFEVTSELQRELVNDKDVSGGIELGTSERPAVYMESIHHLMKVVAGSPNIRPVWFFDTAQQGEGMNDIGTHLVDLVQWTLFPEQAIDYKADIQVLSAQQWPTSIPEADFKKVSGGQSFPASVQAKVQNGALQYDCNTITSYTLRGVHVKLSVIWDWEAPAGAGDRHFAIYRGKTAAVEVRQTKADGYKAELYVVPNPGADVVAVHGAVERRLASIATTYPAVSSELRWKEIHIVIPDKFRDGHEAHFARVTRNFLAYLQDRSKLPSWEQPNMLAKYYVTTTGAELSHQSAPRMGERVAPQ
jgi:predicted dehydrogenase